MAITVPVSDYISQMMRAEFVAQLCRWIASRCNREEDSSATSRHFLTRYHSSERPRIITRRKTDSARRIEGVITKQDKIRDRTLDALRCFHKLHDYCARAVSLLNQVCMRAEVTRVQNGPRNLHQFIDILKFSFKKLSY